MKVVLAAFGGFFAGVAFIVLLASVVGAIKESVGEVSAAPIGERPCDELALRGNVELQTATLADIKRCVFTP